MFINVFLNSNLSLEILTVFLDLLIAEMDFSFLVFGHEYDRPTLAKLWGYESFHAISRGVVTPRNEKIIVLFITKEKQEVFTQYEDHIEQDILFWEGEREHGNDKRIISKQDIIHVFYRNVHHSNFIYEGRAELKSYKLNSVSPSKFVFHLIDRAITSQSIVQEIRESYSLSETEKEAIVKSRRGQGIFRLNSIQLWKKCSVTGFSKENVLIASHIKPWKLSNNSERIDHFNSLLLVPTLDKLFDKGYIGFEPNGKILISSKVSAMDCNKIGLTTALRLSKVPEETKSYLNYHCEYKFDLSSD